MAVGACDRLGGCSDRQVLPFTTLPLDGEREK